MVRMCVTVCVHVHVCGGGEGGGVTLHALRSVSDGMYVRTYVYTIMNVCQFMIGLPYTQTGTHSHFYEQYAMWMLGAMAHAN